VVGLLLGPPAESAEQELNLAWKYRAAEASNVLFPGLVDTAGNLYWLECSPVGSCDLVSSSIEGVIRYRKPISGVHRVLSLDRRHLVLFKEVLIAALEDGTVRAMRARDGAEIWVRDVRHLVCHRPTPPGSGQLEVVPVVGNGGGTLFLRVGGKACLTSSHDPSGGSGHGHWIVSLSPTTGAVRWQTAYPRSIRGVIVDERSDLFFEVDLASDDGRFRPHLVSLSASGQERWRQKKSSSSWPVAAFGGLIFEANREVRHARTGRRAFRLAMARAVGGERNAFTLLGPGAVWVLGRPDQACDTGECQLELRRLSAGGKLAWQAVIGQVKDSLSITQPVLTSMDSVLFAESSAEQSLLREFSADGLQVRSDLLPGGRYVGPTVLHRGWWVALSRSPDQEIRAFSVGGRDAAGEGWITLGGSMGRGGSPCEGPDRPGAAVTSRPPKSPNAKSLQQTQGRRSQGARLQSEQRPPG
jgi:hypothetical protein